MPPYGLAASPLSEPHVPSPFAGGSPDDLLTVLDMARVAQCSARLWRQAIWDGDLAVVRVGRLVRVRRDEFNRYLLARTTAAVR